MAWFACECENNGPLAIEANECPNVYDRSLGYKFRSVLHKPFATEQEAMAHWGEPVIYCKECGHHINLNYFDSERKKLIERNLCFFCNYWSQLIGRGGIVINGEHYMVGSAKTPSSHNGFSGRWFYIKMNDGREIRTCDLWYQGAIPERFRDRLPDNAEFTSGEGWVDCGETRCMRTQR